MAASKDVVLFSWLAAWSDKVDPNREDRGPTRTLLFHPDSPYRGRVERVVMFYNDREEQGDNYRTAKVLQGEVEQHGIEFELRYANIPYYDHEEIASFLRRVLPSLRKRFESQEVVVHVSPGSGAMHAVWLVLVAHGLLPDPVTLVQTLPKEEQAGRGPVVESSFRLDSAFRLLTSLPQGTDTTIGPRIDPGAYRSERYRELYDEATRLASLNVPLLILGERGTGKSTLAEFVWSQSPFQTKEKSLPSVACGQFSSELVRSELFGYVDGAFTGAVKGGRPGLLTAADGGSLFLDEIGDLSTDVQRLLIRAVENHEYVPVGADEVKKSRFRLIAATNRTWDDLQAHIEPDFLDRISYFTLTVPPLRDVPEDLPLLWEWVFYEAARRADATDCLTSETVACLPEMGSRLAGRHLRGNFRDLYRIAFYTLAHLRSGVPPLSAFDNGLRESARAAGALRTKTSTSPVAASLATCAAGTPLDFGRWSNGQVRTKEVLDYVRHYIAEEAQRAASHDGTSLSDLVDVTPRAIQKWIHLSHD